MGNKLNIRLLVILVLLPFLSFPQKKSLADLIKGYLYSYCIIKEYATIDNNNNNVYYKDYSGSYFIQMTDMPLNLLDTVYNFYKLNINKYRGIPQESDGNNKANMVCYTCWSFCEANETKRFIKYILKRRK